MAHAFDPTRRAQIAIAPASLHVVHAALQRALGAGAAPALQEAGYVTGQAHAEGLRAWLATRGEGSLDGLALETFADRLAGYFAELGWGELLLRTSGRVSVVETRSWAEWQARGDGEPPACHFTTGMLAGLFGALAEHPLAVLEVETGDGTPGSCRFLVGSERVLNEVFDRLHHGDDVETALRALSIPG